MAKLWKFLSEKTNRDIVTWIAGGCIAASGMCVSAFNLLSDDQTKVANHPKVVSQTTPCKADAEISSKKNGMIFEDSDHRLLTLVEILKLSDCHRWIARNEIYARKGRAFTTNFLDAHFSSQTWYQAQEPMRNLNPTEQKNIEQIKFVESK